MLLLKKKKYAALTISERNGKITTSKKMSGLDMVRRDWCPLSKEIGIQVLDFILSGKSIDAVVEQIHEYLSEVSTKVRQKEFDMAKFVITKGLNKAPHEYPNAKGQPHVTVAKEMV